MQVGIKALFVEVTIAKIIFLKTLQLLTNFDVLASCCVFQCEPRETDEILVFQKQKKL